MPRIILHTEIFADIETCFDLSRSIDLHLISTAQTNEKAIAGKRSGLIELNESVTWEAVHFGIRQRLTSTITAYQRPVYFRDEQKKGAFKSFCHDHKFEQSGDKIIMTDIFEYHSPFGILGRAFNKLVLTNYLKKLLLKRNNLIKEYAETGQWEQIINSNHNNIAST